MTRPSFSELYSIVGKDLSPYAKFAGRGSILRSLFLYPGFRFTFLMRICGFLRSHPVLRYLSPPFILLFWRMQRVYGLSISYGAEIGGGFYIPHIGLGVLNPAAKLGENVYFGQGVTVGKAHSGSKAGAPVIGNGVFLGPNACVFGAITLGDNCAVGANSVVLHDVPPGVTVAGSPARKISDKGADAVLGGEIA